jgi:hypothetical protein
VRVLRKEAAEVHGDEAGAGSILVWNGLVTRMRRVSADDVDLEERVARDRLPGSLVDQNQHAVRPDRLRLG